MTMALACAQASILALSSAEAQTAPPAMLPTEAARNMSGGQDVLKGLHQTSFIDHNLYPRDTVFYSRTLSAGICARF